MFEVDLRSSAPRFVRLLISIKHSILAHSEKNNFLKKSVLEMSETLLSSLHKQVTPWVSGIAINSPGNMCIYWVKVGQNAAFWGHKTLKFKLLPFAELNNYFSVLEII